MEEMLIGFQELQAAFKDPSSPFHLPPGTKGPDSPDSPPTDHINISAHSPEALEQVPASLADAEQKLIKAGLDPESFWEQRIVWGDQDSFQ